MIFRKYFKNEYRCLYQDFQGIFAANGGSVIKNIGQAEGTGVEFGITYLPTDNLRLFLASTSQNSEVKEGQDLYQLN